MRQIGCRCAKTSIWEDIASGPTAGSLRHLPSRRYLSHQSSSQPAQSWRERFEIRSQGAGGLHSRTKFRIRRAGPRSGPVASAKKPGTRRVQLVQSLLRQAIARRVRSWRRRRRNRQPRTCQALDPCSRSRRARRRKSGNSLTAVVLQLGCHLARLPRHYIAAIRIPDGVPGTHPGIRAATRDPVENERSARTQVIFPGSGLLLLRSGSRSAMAGRCTTMRFAGPLPESFQLSRAARNPIESRGNCNALAAHC